MVIACPLTTKIKGYKGNIILKPNDRNGLSKKSEVLAFHISPISKDRLVKMIGFITNEELAKIKLTLDDIMRY
ncbi:MAG: type II toxin-antitoxin system PemK/MazF family toxin [Bacteroidales bacterium]|nr:type II toxin-antitoxin system PemK/MazF family toxin [Bacteroidales bacterium]